MLLHQCRVEFSRDQMKVVNQIGPIHQKPETFELHLIMGFKQEVYMPFNSTAYYRVRAETTFGKPITLADGITSEGSAADDDASSSTATGATWWIRSGVVRLQSSHEDPRYRTESGHDHLDG